MNCPICNLNCTFNNGNTYTCESNGHFYQKTDQLMETLKINGVMILNFLFGMPSQVSYNGESLMIKSIDINKFLSCKSKQDIDNWFFNLQKQIVFS